MIPIHMETPVVHEIQVGRLERALREPYYPVNPVMAYGRPEAVTDRALRSIGAKRHFVKGDGSCWARATWMCALSQVLDDPQKFAQFIRLVEESPEKLNVPENLAVKALQILGHLQQMSWDERYDLLNHENVDRDLIFYMRHVAGEMMTRHASIYTPQEIDEIKTNIHRFGGPESTFFARYFNLELHLVTKKGKRWVYQQKESDKNYYEHPIDLGQGSANIGCGMCLFGVNDSHFEFLSF